MEKLTKKGLDGTQLKTIAPVSYTHLVENSAAFSRTADSVGSTIGIITLGRPSPMQKPRMLTQDMALLLYVISIATLYRIRG